MLRGVEDRKVLIQPKSESRSLNVSRIAEVHSSMYIYIYIYKHKQTIEIDGYSRKR